LDENALLSFLNWIFEVGLVELDIKEGHGIKNEEDWDDFVRDGEEGEDLDFCMKNSGDSSTQDCMYWSRHHAV